MKRWLMGITILLIIGGILSFQSGYEKTKMEIDALRAFRQAAYDFALSNEDFAKNLTAQNLTDLHSLQVTTQNAVSVMVAQEKQYRAGYKPDPRIADDMVQLVKIAQDRLEIDDQYISKLSEPGNHDYSLVDQEARKNRDNWNAQMLNLSNLAKNN